MGMFDFMAGQQRTPTWDEVQRRRALADALAGSIGAPTTLGEGLSSIGAALGGVLANRKADRMDAARAAEADNVFEAALAGVPQDNSPLAAALGGTFAAPTNAPPAVADALAPAPSGDPLRDGIIETAQAIGADPVDLATAISYETAGTFDPMKAGPTTQWGQHRGLIQFGHPQAKQYGADFSSPEAALRSQLGANGAVANYFRSSGFKPGMSGLDLYSTINAGAPGKYSASDANNGGAPGDVRDKWERQMSAHREKAMALLGGDYQPAQQAPGQAMPGFAPISIPAPPPVNVAMIRAMNNPYLSPEQRQILGGIMAQQQANQITPYQMAQLQMQQQGQAMQAARFGLEMQQATQPKPVQWDTREVNGGVVQVNPMTGETRQVVAPIPKGPDFRPATAEEAARYGAQAGQFGPDGRFYPNNPPSGLAIETGPDGQVRVVQGAGAQGAAGKPFTEAQSKDNIYATRAEGALATLDPISGALPDRGAILADKVPLGMARGVQSDQYQVARAAADEFLQAILRKDTGAAITAQEQELYGKTYLPQPGDSEAAMAQKQQARRRAVEALKSGMSPAQIIAQEKALQASGSPSLLPVAPAAPPMRGDAGGIKWKVLD